MTYAVKLISQAERKLDSFQADLRDRIIVALERLKDNPRPSGCKKLKSRDAYRIRVGDYRVIYEIHDDVLIVLIIRIAHRNEAYK
ncbi:MAG: type II toxin-antitoxin system RelE/ParE family toxin [Synergistaceae bacterium]|nr:type II toxin-antitoxin system RelE/ParE family toxin [Synergistaceae bacterium]